MERMPLEGYRILDLSTYLTGAGGVAMLGDLGAEVIKIESRQRPDPSRASAHQSQMFEFCNRNKRALTLDLKSEAGKRVFYRLVETADVVAENFRVGVAGRLGIDHPTLSRHNPLVILASFNGFGSKGPDAQIGSFDMLGHARSGLMDITSEHQPPTPIRYVGPIALSDQTGALTFAFGILAALAARAVDRRGQHVEVSHLSAMLTLQNYPLHNWLASHGTGPLPRPPDRRLESPLSNWYQAGDGKWVAISSVGDAYWPKFCQSLELPDLIEDERYRDAERRAANIEPLIALLDERFKTRPRAEWMARLQACDVNFSPVQEYPDLLVDPQVIANDNLPEIEHPTHGRMQVIRPPVTFSNATEVPTRGAGAGTGHRRDPDRARAVRGGDRAAPRRFDRLKPSQETGSAA